MRALLLITLLLLAGCEGDYDENPIPHVEEARAMCASFGGIAYLRTQLWRDTKSLRIVTRCNDGTYVERRRKG